jgi:hypothetical protein
MTDTSSIAQQVSHWVHDEQTCVTVQRIVQSFGLSWAEASSTLKKIPEKDRTYFITLFGQSDTKGDGSNDVPENGNFRCCFWNSTYCSTSFHKYPSSFL